MTASATIRQVITAEVPEPPAGIYSNCFVVGDTIHISGQHAGIPGGVVGGDSILLQAREAFKRVLALIQAAGGTANDVVKIMVYLVDVTKRNEVTTVRREIFAEPMPCSTLIGVNALAMPELLIEIDAIAVIGAGGRRAAPKS